MKSFYKFLIFCIFLTITSFTLANSKIQYVSNSKSLWCMVNNSDGKVVNCYRAGKKQCEKVAKNKRMYSCALVKQ